MRLVVLRDEGGGNYEIIGSVSYAGKAAVQIPYQSKRYISALGWCLAVQGLYCSHGGYSVGYLSRSAVLEWKHWFNYIWSHFTSHHTISELLR